MATQQQSWQATTPWWQKSPELRDPSSWPLIAPISATLFGAREGGANWIPGLSPVLSGPSNLLQGSGQAMFDVGSNVWKGLTTNPAAQRVPGPVAAPIAAPDVLSFGGGGLGADAGASGPSTVNTPDQFILGMFPGAKITSGFRTPEKNAKVKGVANSMHLDDMARDFVLPAGTDKNAAVAALKQTGFFTEVLNEGNHIHVGWRPKGVNAATPTVSASQVFAGGMPVQYLDPNFAMSMVPNPRLVGQVKFPDAPQRELPATLPDLEQADKAGILAELQKVIQPKEPDQKFDKWDRIAALLQGAAGAAATADPAQGIGQFLLRAGAGAAGGFREETKAQKAKREDYEERVRQANVALAKLGIDIDLGNLQTRNVNVDRRYKSGEDTKDVKYGNANATFQTQLNNILTNLGITQQNVGSLNSRDMARANVGLNAFGGQVNAQNQANASVLAGGAGAPAMQEKSIQTMLVGAGIDAANAKNPYLTTARGTAAAILANDVNGALQNMAQELVLAGAAQSILAPTKGEDANTAKVKAEALRALKADPTGKKGGAQQAMQLLAQLMTTNHAAALQIAKDFQATSPSARIILQQNKAPVK